MGQEASLPADGSAPDYPYDDATRNAAMAGATTSDHPQQQQQQSQQQQSQPQQQSQQHHPQQQHAPPGGGLAAAAAAGRSSRKLMQAMFRSAGNAAASAGGGGGGSAASYEQREVARAIAAGGNLYLPDDASTSDFHHSYPGSGAGSGVASLPAAHHLSSQSASTSSADSTSSTPTTGAPTTAPYYSDPLDMKPRASDKPVVGVMYERQSSAKKSLLSGRASARGAALISSMRNLNIGAALRSSRNQPNKQGVQEWAQQWDEDEDDSEEGDDETDADPNMPIGAPLHQQQAQQNHHQLRMEAGHSALNPPMEETDMATSLEAQQLASPSATLPAGVNTAPLTNSERNFVTPDYSSPVLPPAAPHSPTHSHHVHRSAAPGPQSPNHSVQPAVVEDDGVEWDTNAASPPSTEGDFKPNVQMFMPMLRVLGKGSFGKVVLVQKNSGKERGGLFAMKILRKTHLVKRRQIERTRTERKVLSVVNHPFIMKLHYAFQTPDKLYLVLDYCPGGELFFHLSRFRRFPERVARFYSAELLLAIGHLHKRGIIYRDLKPENVLLDADGHVKLGDFGLAKAGIQHPCEGAISMCGTPEYLAPEVLANSGHGFCVDYWGLGMLLYEMMTGLPPWYTTDRAKLFRRLKSAPLDIPSYFSGASADCVSALLERNQRRRLGVAGIRTAMEHEFFRNISWRSLYARKVEAPIRPCEGWKPPEAINDEIFPGIQNGSGPTSVESMGNQDLEAATANFDNTFTRMPVESEDTNSIAGGGGNDGLTEECPEGEQLDENTFRGFSFDIKERDAENALAASVAAATPPRSHRFTAHALD